MSQIEIPRESWKSFCDEFTHQHQSWIVNLSASDEKPGAEIGMEKAEQRMTALAHMAVFRIISAMTGNGDYTISIVAGQPPEIVSHVIDNPAHLFFCQNEEGAHEGLIIESESGQTTLMRFRVAALPETLDGITEAELITM